MGLCFHFSALYCHLCECMVWQRKETLDVWGPRHRAELVKRRQGVFPRTESWRKRKFWLKAQGAFPGGTSARMLEHQGCLAPVETRSHAFRQLASHTMPAMDAPGLRCLPADCRADFSQQVRAHETVILGNSWWTLWEKWQGSAARLRGPPT